MYVIGCPWYPRFTIYRRSVYSFISVHVYTGVVVLFLALAAAPVPKKVEYGEKNFFFVRCSYVTVIKQSQVQFINKPVEKAIGEPLVNFTLPHWISFVSVARPKIRNAIKEGKEESFLYHRNRKVAKVLHRIDTTANQVHLMTFTAKGAPKRDLCVYLTEKECEELEKLITQINEFLDNTFPKQRKYL